MTATITVISIYLFMSLVCFILFFIDKKRSVASGWRIKEYHLHLVELLGGWPGALLGQKFIRHKTKKTRYKIVLWLIILTHGLLWGYFIYGLSTKFWW
ncbi:MAG: cold-shock protein [Hyphomicrobiales bacterium]|nr:MAG: cold-shock protein [Hyphomicrobiales bacterium]